MGPLVVSLLLGFTGFLLFLWYSSRKHSYWKEKNVPYAKAYPIFGSTFENLTSGLHGTELKRYRKLGRIYGHYEGYTPVLSVGEPELLRKIMVKDFHAFTGRRELAIGDKIVERMVGIVRGEDWKRIRTILTPTFSTGKIKRMLGILKDCSKTLVKNFKTAVVKDETVEVKGNYGAFTMDAILSSLFSTKIDSHNDPDNEFVAAAKDVLVKRINWRFLMFAIFPGIMKFFRIRLMSPKGIDFVSNATQQIIEERRRTGQVSNDFLQLLMDTAKEVSQDDNTDNNTEDIAQNYGKDANDQVFKNIYSKKSLSFNELVAQCANFLIAGYETTASTLAFVTYLLALHPDIQEKLIQEIDNALKESSGELTYESIQSMKYLDNVISETLRLYPPAVRLERIADEDFKCEDTGIIIPKGMILSIPVYGMHRDPDFFPDPEKFDPDRFNPEERAKRHQYVYLPFGAGPRNCIGMRFALIEIKVCLAHVLSNFRIKRCPETKVPLDFFLGQGFILQPKNITVKVEIRKDTVKAL